MNMAPLILCLHLLVFLRSVHVANSSVKKFPCGNDICVPNVHFCSHEDSTDSLKWRCSPCVEEKWKCRDLTIHPECLGFCGQLQTQREKKEFESYKNKTNGEIQIYQMKIDGFMAVWNKSNDTIQELKSSMVERDAEIVNLRNVITAVGCGCGCLVVVLIIVVLCCWKKRQNQTRTGRVLDEEKSFMLKKKCACDDAVDCCGIRSGTRPKENGGKAELCPNQTKTVTEF